VYAGDGLLPLAELINSVKTQFTHHLSSWQLTSKNNKWMDEQDYPSLQLQ